MLLKFNTLLNAAGIELSQVRLLRHMDKRAQRGRSPFELWRDDREGFEAYQSIQSIDNRQRLRGAYWASFVGVPGTRKTLFVGVYSVSYRGILDEDRKMPHRDEVDQAGTADEYQLTLDKRFMDLDGRLFIEWGEGTRSWIQRADTQDKPIAELTTGNDPPLFPGFLNLIFPLSHLDGFHPTWIAILECVKGVYLLTCPRTKEQYVGSAYGAGGFWSRWQEYARNGHGGNVALKSRDPSDYQVSILEVVSSSLSNDEIIARESLWKQKLRSQEMGLNRN